MKYKKHSDEFKEQVVKEYLSGRGLHNLMQAYVINKTQISRWTNKYLEHGCFPDGRGKAKTGRSRKINISEMSQEEYIKYLEMENTILKQLCSLSKNQQR